MFVMHPQWMLCNCFRGVHLKDLILLNTALPDWVEGGFVNFRKMVQLSMIFTELMQVQNATLPIEPNMDLVNTVRVRSTFHYIRAFAFAQSLFRKYFKSNISMSNHWNPSKVIIWNPWGSSCWAAKSFFPDKMYCTYEKDEWVFCSLNSVWNWTT